MRLVFMGTPEFAVPSLEALIQARHEVTAVVTQPDRPRGRGRVLTAPPVKGLALRHGIPVLQPDRVRQPEFIEQLRLPAPEIIVVVAFGQILPRAVLDIAPRGCVNVHASLLPRYRGAAPIQYALMEGEEVTGVTTMLLDAGTDTGQILLQEQEPILTEDTAGSLSVRLAARGAGLLLKTLAALEAGAVTPIPQDSSRATYAPMLKREDGLVEWNWAARRVRNRIRGCSPRPGAYTFWRGRLLKLWQSSLAEVADSNSAAGTVVGFDGPSLAVQTGEGVLHLVQMQPEDGKRMTGVEFARGHSLQTGDRLG